jgi:hypothetical protein
MRQRYARQIGEVWPRVNRALVRLEHIAADPDALDTHAGLPETLAHLQYDLHLGSEHVWSLTPPPGAQLLHSALAIALADARDLTGRVVSTLERGDFAGFEQLQPEWCRALRGAQSARRKLVWRRRKPQPLELRDIAPQLAALAIAVSGGVLISAVAVPLWPLWGVGLLAVSGAVGLVRA